MGPMVLTYHLPSIKALFQDDFPVHKVGYVSFQENNIFPPGPWCIFDGKILVNMPLSHGSSGFC